jgi:hypothetical protein
MITTFWIYKNSKLNIREVLNMSDLLEKSKVFTDLRDFQIKMRMEYNAEYKVVLYTAIGRVVCDLEPLAPRDSLIGISDDPAAVSVDVSALFSGDNPVNAKNVIIYKHDSNEELTRADQIMLFADQILGFSLLKQ